MNEKLAHTALDSIEVKNNQLQIGGRSISEIAAQAGQTPFYVYDRHSIKQQLRKLKQAIPGEVHLHYAVKANPMPALVTFLQDKVQGFDVASAQEMQVALNAGMDPALISFAGPGKQEREIRQAIAADIVINAESESELEKISFIATDLGKKPRVAIRINPDFELKSSGMKMGGGAKQFGIDAERVPEVLANWDSSVMSFAGFHIFSGSQNLRPEAIVEAQTKAVDLAVELSEHAPAAPEILNIGGGFGIPYFPGEQALDLESIGENLKILCRCLADELPQTQLVIELGRYIVGEAGFYVCEVVDKKVSRGEVFLVTNGGIHHHLAATGNFGQVIRKNYPVVIGNRIEADIVEAVNIVGPCCTPLDILGSKMELPKADVGDLVVILQSGAYGRTASPSAFLSHPDVVELLI